MMTDTEKIAALRKLHQRVPGGFQRAVDMCAACVDADEYQMEWPCPTMEIVDEIPAPSVPRR